MKNDGFADIIVTDQFIVQPQNNAARDWLAVNPIVTRKGRGYTVKGLKGFNDLQNLARRAGVTIRVSGGQPS